jgi:hypothetical protein
MSYFSTPSADENKSYAVRCLADIAVAQRESGFAETATITIKRALDIARTISGEYRSDDHRSSALQAVAVAQANLGDFDGASQTIREIVMEHNRRWAQRDVAASQARAGFRVEAVRTAEGALIEREKVFEELADVFVQIGDREGLKRLLIPCAQEIGSAHRLCLMLSKLYPEQLSGLIETVVRAES